ncbi:proteoglycan 4a [Anarrhichthys ocellatus]|uniref:proteoglycan 4a n=1 Tax=Anarrhichthys ocellatus TaxID=433405 RepID=UPI0012ECECA9|nr:proteoglycan 4-like [Anarrhichthys ocellatus]
MMRMMSLLLLLLGLAVTYTAAAGPGSCMGRCGEVFSRGQRCTCDFSCLQHNECCLDFQATCTAAQSCQGRCGEAFRRGRLCECDPQCIQYNTCCPNYQQQCDASRSVSHTRIVQPVRPAASANLGSESSWRSNSASEEWYTGVRNIPVGLLPMSMPVSHSGAPVSPARGFSLPSHSALSLGSSAPVSPSDPGAVDGPSGPAVTEPRPSTLQDVAQALGLVEGGSEGPGTGLLADANLCSDSPINGLTALSNGTILIFKGDLFWTVDAVSRSVGHPQSITDTLGVPSPIDTVFTRCNCRAHTYIIKGEQYWRLDGNMVMEPGYPKPLVSEFPGLTGSISAALAVAASSSTAETVYFFKRGDIMQRFTFLPGSTPSCSKTQRGSSRRRAARQAVLLSGEINVKVSLMGFPTPVTSALSMPSPQRRDPYEHYVFSGPFFFSVQISGDLPALTKPHPSAALVPILSPVTVVTSVAAQNANAPLPANSIRVWLRCP